MSPTVVTFLFEAANFLVLAVVLGWLFFKPVRQAIADYRDKFEADNQKAADHLAEAEKTRQEIDTARANLEAEMNKRRTSEIEAAKQRAEQILADARSAADRELEESHRQAARMSDTQRDRLAEVAASVAAETVGRLLRQIAGPDLQSALVQSACHQLASLSKDGLLPIKIESAQRLTDEQIAMLNEALGQAAEAAQFRTVDTLGPGVRLSTGQGLIDASASGLALFARQSLVKEMQQRANNHNPLHGVNDD